MPNPNDYTVRANLAGRELKAYKAFVDLCQTLKIPNLRWTLQSNMVTAMLSYPWPRYYAPRKNAEACKLSVNVMLQETLANDIDCAVSVFVSNAIERTCTDPAFRNSVIVQTFADLHITDRSIQDQLLNVFAVYDGEG